MHCTKAPMRCFRHEDTDEVFSPFIVYYLFVHSIPWNERSALLQLLLLLLLLLMILIHTPIVRDIHKKDARLVSGIPHIVI